MILVGFRNLLTPLRPSAIDSIAEADRRCFAEIDRRRRREMQRLALTSLLKDMMGGVTEMPPSSWHLNRDDDGVPELVISDGTINVSFSHSGPLAIVGITDLGEIGVDAEYRRPRSLADLAAYAFGPREQEAVEAGGMEAFYRIWTLREALSKACRAGFPMLADGRDYFPEQPASRCWQTTIEQRRCLFWTGEIDRDYALSIAVAPRSDVGIEQLTQLIPTNLSNCQH